MNEFMAHRPIKTPINLDKWIFFMQGLYGVFDKSFPDF